MADDVLPCHPHTLIFYFNSQLISLSYLLTLDKEALFLFDLYVFNTPSLLNVSSTVLIS